MKYQLLEYVTLQTYCEICVFLCLEHDGADVEKGRLAT